MIIDFHTHIFPDEIAHSAVEALASKVTLKPSFMGKKEELLQSMHRGGIDYSVILPVVTKPSQTAKANVWASKMQDEKIFAFGGLHPLNEDYKERVDEAVALGLKGIKMHPDYQGFFVDDEKMFPIYDYILGKELSILFHAGVDIGLPAPYGCPPFRLRKVLDRMQGGVIIAAHLGGHNMWEDVERYLVGTAVYLDTSMGLAYYGEEVFKRIVKNHTSKKILFGTDAPWDNQGDELKRLLNVGLHEEDFENITFQNAKHILKIGN